MKVKISLVPFQENEQIHFFIHRITKDIEKLVSKAKGADASIYGRKDSEGYQIWHSDICYFESVDKKTFVYTADDVFHVSERLYQLEALLDPTLFLRISKSMTVNLDKITAIRPTLSGRFEAVLDNQEKISISRSYVKNLEKTLGATAGSETA